MLTVQVLGSQAVVDEASGAIRSRSARTVALLTFLVAHTGRPVDRARIAGLFWPESTDVQALTNLRRELHQLRRLLAEDESLEITSSQLCWRDLGKHDVDLATFLRESAAAERAESEDEVLAHGAAAIAAYGGTLLSGTDAPWLDDLRRDLAERCSSVCVAVSRAARSRGRLDLATRATRKRLTIDRYDEGAVRDLMRLSAELGDRAGAVSAYQQLATALRSELGVSPDERTTELLAELIGDTDEPQHGANRSGANGSGASRSGAEPHLIGRRAELATLLKTWQATAAGRAHVVVVSGGAGVGKSRLVAELGGLARQAGVVVALSRSFDTGGRLSLAPVVDWLREPELIAARRELPEVWRTEVDRLVPEAAKSTGPALQDRAPLSASGGADVWQRHRFFEGLARALLAGSRPLLLVLDNLQWSDRDTLSFIRFLLNLAPRARLLVATTLRTGPTGDNPLPDGWLSGLREESLLTEIALSPLTADQTATLAGSLTGHSPSPSEQEQLYLATGGFPLYVVQAARSVLDSGGAASTPLVDWMGILPSRIQRLSPVARELAGLAAAVGRDFTLPVLAEASDLDPESLGLAVEELWRRRIIAEGDGRYDFCHDLLRTAAYDAVSPPRRRLLHRRLAQAMELLAAGRMDPVATQIAEQYRQAGEDQRALRYYRRAAEVAAGMYAHDEAVSLLRTAGGLLSSLPASREHDEQELTLLELSVPPLNARFGYASPQVREACERSVELADELGLRTRMLTAMVGLWASRFVEGRLLAAYQLAEQVVELVGPQDERFGQAHFALGGSALQRGLPTVASEHFRIALDQMGDESLTVGTKARVHTVAWLAHACWVRGDYRRAGELCAQASLEARASGHRYSLVVARAFEAITHQLMGHRSACADAAEDVQAMCRRYEFSYYDGWGRILSGWARGGENGVRLIEAGIASLEIEQALVRMPYWLGLLAQTTPDPAYASLTLDRALQIAERSGERLWIPELLRLQAAHCDAGAREPLLYRAIQVARAQHSPAMAARCLTDLGRRSLTAASGH
jgi:DNA-binding SARP family transcriptional activator/predicted ATPase